jgi:hypothetical protein
MKKVFEPEVLYESVLKQKSFRFSIRIAKFYKILIQRDKAFEPLFKQVLRSGTSIGLIYPKLKALQQRKIL